MNDIWKQILEEIKQISPEIYKTVNKPATITEIKELDGMLPCHLPQSLVDFFLVFNGQSENGVDFPLIGYKRFLPIEEIIKVRENLEFLFGDEEPIEHIKENKTKPVFWDNLWIPFAEYNGTDRLFLDLNPGKNGVYGQVITDYPGIDRESDKIVVASSFEHFSKECLRRLKNNEFKIENDTIQFADYWTV